MNAGWKEDVERLRAQAQELPEGGPRAALQEEAVRLADAHGDVDLGYQVRNDLIDTATFGGYPEKALVAFSWCLAQCDRRPEQFPESAMLWKYKWVVGALERFPQITRPQIEQTLDDLEQRFLRCGATPYAVLKLRCNSLDSMGDLRKAKQLYRRWQAAPRDWLSDCHACCEQSAVETLVEWRQDEAALAKAAPLLQGRLRCRDVPTLTYARVLLPLVRLGRVAEAAHWHRRGYRALSAARHWLRETAYHLDFLVLTDNTAKALRGFEKHLPLTLDNLDQSHVLRLYLAGQLLFARLAEVGKTTVRLRVPSGLPFHDAGGAYEPRRLAAALAESCREIAARFDARNGNRYVSRQVAAHRRLRRFLTPHSLEAKPDSKIS